MSRCPNFWLVTYIHFQWNAPFALQHCVAEAVAMRSVWFIRWICLTYALNCMCRRLDRNDSRRWMLNFCYIHMMLLRTILIGTVLPVVPKRNDAVRVIEALGHAFMVVIQPVSLYKWNLSHHPPWRSAWSLLHGNHHQGHVGYLWIFIMLNGNCCSPPCDIAAY